MQKPPIEANHVLIETCYSAISSGTELLLKNRMTEHPISLGYSAMGIVQEIGEGITHVSIGQRVACYGAPYVRHAEILAVPRHLVVPLPDECNSQEAAFVGLGAIAIHALRQADLRFGESVVVVGLGILGQIASQIAEASGYRLIGFDLLEERCAKLSEACTAIVYSHEQDVRSAIDSISQQQGADAVIICANGANAGIIDQALGWIRDKGKIVIVGDVKMDFDRELMFAKEAQVLISRAGGPGRYDSSYESKGNDYPISYVRWTEGRNMAEFIRLLAEKRISIEMLISHKMTLSSMTEAYELLHESPQDVLGVLVDYGKQQENEPRMTILETIQG
ncbi:zinc-dependent alcohol dehydrogenase [Paenibacillus psychroresistens]|uniref:zinc-dependent alcohol dehydrogenase n=1 Tax=Paenibacillus psychroresistens TaxID=1778678 RepID=UPI001D050DBD|nr:zinc-binding alcohol dehydrogenase [Paenibacillus psychroresistens]